MKIIKYMILGVALLLSVGCQKSDQHKNTVVVGVSPEYPPFEFKHNGELQGHDIDFAKALGKQLGKEVVFADMDFNSLIPSVINGKVDMVIAEVTKTPARTKVVDFSSIYYQANFAIISRKENSITSLNDLAQHKVGVQMGSTMEQLAKKQSGAEVISLAANPVLIEQLKLARVDAVIMETAQAHEFVKNNPGLTFHVVGKTGQGYAIAFAKNSAWTAKTEAALQELKKKNVLNELKHKWLGE